LGNFFAGSARPFVKILSTTRFCFVEISQKQYIQGPLFQRSLPLEGIDCLEPDNQPQPHHCGDYREGSSFRAARRNNHS
jgi:hypothetical protein